ncbi:TolC family outer membrane protein [Oceanisphaera ostreae]|uniref:TolC family outer membrane protein n=1 Tax=Oceanisphaera ostreae TaxID=914151 RepID=A0ABW3KG43_9GAMM
MFKKSPLAKIVLTACLSIIPFSGLSAAQQDNLLSVVKETLDTQPELQAQLDAFNASTHDERQAFGGYLPTLDLNLSGGRAQRDFDNRSDYSRNYAEVSLTQMLFDGFRVRNALAKAEHTSLTRYYELLNEAETKALEASDAYLSVLRHRELVTLAQQNVANHQRVNKQVGERVRQGVSNKADLQQIDGRLSLARSNLMTEIANLQTVTARFQRLVGRFPTENLTEFSVPKQVVPRDLSTVLNTVYHNNPSLFAAAENTQAATASYNETKANRYPTIELSARHGTYKNNNSFDDRTDPSSYGDESIVELRASYNLYNGGSDQAGEYAAYSRIHQAESLHHKTCVDLRQTATIAHSDMLNIDRKLVSLLEHRDASANVVVAYRQQFNISRRSLLDVLDSENESFQAERAYVDGTYDLQLARLHTLHSMGNLLDTLSVSSEKIPTLSDLNGSPSPTSQHFCVATAVEEFDYDRYMQPVTGQDTFNLSGDTLFDTNSAELKPAALSEIHQLVQRTLEQGTPRAISIVGHTDNVGSADLNQKLSLARAKAVRDVLIDSGIDSTILAVSGVGAAQPTVSNDTAQDRALNRRVELKITRAR